MQHGVAKICVCVYVCGCCLVSKSCPILLRPHGLYPPGSSVHWISQARIPEWVVNSFSRGSSRPRDQTRVSCIGRWIPYHWATREAQYDVHIYTHTHTYAHMNICLKTFYWDRWVKSEKSFFFCPSVTLQKHLRFLQSPGSDHYDFKYFTYGTTFSLDLFWRRACPLPVWEAMMSGLSRSLCSLEVWVTGPLYRWSYWVPSKVVCSGTHSQGMGSCHR